MIMRVFFASAIFVMTSASIVSAQTGATATSPATAGPTSHVPPQVQAQVQAQVQHQVQVQLQQQIAATPIQQAGFSLIAHKYFGASFLRALSQL